MTEDSTQQVPLFRQHQDFEFWVLVSAIRHWPTMSRLADSVCVPIPGKKFKTSTDFADPKYNHIFSATRATYAGMTDEEKEDPASIVRYRQRLLDLLRNLPSDDAADRMELVNGSLEITNAILGLPQETVDTCIPHAHARHTGPWLEARKLAAVTAGIPLDVARGSIAGVDQVIERLEEIKRQIGASGDGHIADIAEDFIDLVDSPDRAAEHEVEIIPTPWPNLNTKIGGGLAKGTASLFCATQGGGKTIATGQIAAYAAQLGFKVLIVSSEEPMSTFQFRTASAFANVPWDTIQFKTLKTVTQAQKDAIKTIFSPLKAKLMYVDWTQEAKVDIQTMMPAVLEQFRETYGAYPDVLAYDWIGAGLDYDKSDLNNRSKLMERAGNFMGQMAARYNVAVMATAQIDPNIGNSKYQYYRNDIRDCKSLGAKFTTVVMMSAMKKMGTIVRTDRTDLEPKQCMNVDKARVGGKTGPVWVHADFSYQRFLPWGDSGSPLPNPIA